MASIFGTELAMQMTLCRRAANGRWTEDTGPPRALGYSRSEGAIPVEGGNAATRNMWLMTNGLVKPEILNDTTRLVIRRGDNAQFAPPLESAGPIGFEEWHEQQIRNWQTLEAQQATTPRAIEWVESNSAAFANLPDFSLQAPPIPGGQGLNRRQIDEGTMGVYRGLTPNGASFGEYIGELLVSSNGDWRSECWVVNASFAEWSPPGRFEAPQADWINLGPSRLVGVTPGSPQDFLDEAWSQIGAAGASIICSKAFSAMPTQFVP